MLKLYPLYSGSSGNMYLIRSPKATVIVDIGVSFKSLQKSLETLIDKIIEGEDYVWKFKWKITKCSK